MSCDRTVFERGIHGAPAEALRQALKALAGLSFWIAWTADPDLHPEIPVSARCMRDAATALRKAARLLDDAADRADPPPGTADPAPARHPSPENVPGDRFHPPAIAARAPGEHPVEAERSPGRAGAGGPQRPRAAPVPSSTETSMNHIASPPEPLIREIPLCRLALAPENVRKTPPDGSAQAQLRASIKAHGLLENLVARADGADTDGIECFAVVAGGRRLAALKALAEDGTFHADHPVPCKIAANGNAGELSLAENVIRIAMHPADQVVAFSTSRPVRRHGGRHRRAFRRHRAHRRAAPAPRQRRARAARRLPRRGHRPRDAEGVRGHHRPRPPARRVGAGLGPGLPAERPGR